MIKPGAVLPGAVMLSALVAAGAGDSYELSFSTYLGGSGYEHIRDVCADRHGNVYVAGGTTSPDFRTLRYATYIGGTKRDDDRTGFLDRRGNWYLAGETRSTDWPARNAFQAAFRGHGDAMVAKLVPAGQKDSSQRGAAAATRD